MSYFMKSVLGIITFYVVIIIGCGLILAADLTTNDIYTTRKLKEFFHTILEALLYDTTYHFPLSTCYRHKYTLFGKILFTIIWVLFLFIPFILSIIFALITWITRKVIMATCYKKVSKKNKL